MATPEQWGNDEPSAEKLRCRIQEVLRPSLRGSVCGHCPSVMRGATLSK